MAKSVDVGTMFIIGAKDIEDGVEFTRQRDAFFVVEESPGAEQMLKNSKAKYIKQDNKFYVLGDDAIVLANIMGSSIRRPMAKGVINPEESENAKTILHEIIKGVTGEPSSKDEAVCACIPAAPLDATFNTIFHKAVIENALKSAGYSNINIINEGMALIYSSNPTIITEDEEVPFSGIAISFGSGMTNLAFAYRGLELVSFSVARGGDWIDEQVSTVQSKPVSKVTTYKETKLDLSIPPLSDMDYALHTFYRSLIEYVIFNFKNEFKKTDKSIDEAIEIVVGGGTAMPKGFVKMFQGVLKGEDFPFEIRDVRLAEDPHNAIANGCLINAQALEG